MLKKFSYDILVDDVQVIQDLLEKKEITSVDLVELHLEQIKRYDDYLHAMLHFPEKSRLLAIAAALDKERSEGKLRSPLHGIPIVVKENISMHPSLGMRSSAGSFALLDSRPSRNAKVIDQIIDAGLIILGTANLSEFANFRGFNNPSGWSAVGGQVQSAYVKGGFSIIKDSKDGHSNPSGSSAGSAVAVSAGYAPLSLGTETDGSVVHPAGRAALYSIKPSIGIVSQLGVIPVSHTMDSVGPMGKSARDVALLMDILREDDAPGYPEGGYTTALSGDFSTLSLATVDSEKWLLSADYMAPIADSNIEMIEGYDIAYDKIASLAKRFHKNVPLISYEHLEPDGIGHQIIVMLADFKADLEAYLASLEYSEVRTLQDIVDFNLKHADKELPPAHDDQDAFTESIAQKITPEEYDHHLNSMRSISREQGLDRIFSEYDVDVIIGPADSYLSTMASASGYPIVSVPVGTLQVNGRAYGASAVAGRFQEAKLIHFMSAWEKAMGPRPIPLHLDGL